MTELLSTAHLGYNTAGINKSEEIIQEVFRVVQAKSNKASLLHIISRSVN